ncbi:unnamed protein product [Haemonchus placei]|uniref:Nuclear receptor domain-containing protein n=1 Tax=Haemonchus placei TaxID=6290 RepID=A0A0N4VX61_HAEPC|nr:unnamed protein product [Haemonchus placei]
MTVDPEFCFPKKIDSVHSYTLFQSNDESGSSGSPEVKKEETENFGGVKCFSCHRTSDYGIVSSSFEQPRCQECFDALRNQAGALPATVRPFPPLRSSTIGGL